MQIVALGLVFFATVSATIAVRFSDVLANASSDFAATLLQQAGEATSSSGDNTRNSNVILSPLSVMTGLSMLSLGAKAATAQEIRKAITRSLSLPKLARGMDSLRRISNTADRLTTADRIWPKQGTRLNKEFVQKVRYVFRAAVEAVDFDQESAARQRINEWASNATNGEIDEVVPPGFLSASTRMILTDAIYFKGEWKSEFEAKETKCARFRACDRCASGAVDMMSQTGDFPYRYSTKDRVAVLEMPYRGDNVSMFVLLPDDCASMSDLQANMNGAKIRELIGGLTSQNLDVRFPRFQLNYRASLAKTLQRMGIRSAFTAGVADFSGIDGTQNLYVSDAVHEAVINVDEEGSKAAAVTSMLLSARMMPMRAPQFRADRPFLFVIVDKRSNATLFAGRIADPREFDAKKCDDDAAADAPSRCSPTPPPPPRRPTTDPGPCRCPIHRSNDISLDEFCASNFDFVLVGRLQSIQEMPSRLRYHLQVDRVLKPGSSPMRRGLFQDYLWPKKLYYKRCECELERGKRYIIAGHDNRRGAKKVLKMDSFVAERMRPSDVERVKTFLHQCRKRSSRKAMKKDT